MKIKNFPWDHPLWKVGYKMKKFKKFFEETHFRPKIS